MRPRVVLLVLVLLVSPAEAQQPVPPPSAAPAEDGQWTMPAKNYAGTRFSGLDEITAANVGQLQVAFSFSTGVNRGQESAPIVVGTTMYLVTPYPNVVYALDLERSGALKWQHNPRPDAAAQGVACCDVVNRGPTYDDGKIFLTTLDAHVRRLQLQRLPRQRRRGFRPATDGRQVALRRLDGEHRAVDP